MGVIDIKNEMPIKKIMIIEEFVNFPSNKYSKVKIRKLTKKPRKID
jgi:hypothetical protein